jgi:hypothetical protein
MKAWWRQVSPRLAIDQKSQFLEVLGLLRESFSIFSSFVFRYK